MAEPGITKRDLAFGGVTAAVVHAGLGAAIYLAPAAGSAANVHGSVEADHCTAVVSTACVVGERRPLVLPPERKQAGPDERRCPDPLRRVLRRDPEPPPAVAVDLLQAELVAAKGVETGTVAEPPKVAAPKPAEPPRKLAEALGQDTRLSDILTDEKAAADKKKRLGEILGRADGRDDGQGKVNQSGSAYVREIKIAITKAFSVPANIPPWEVADLVAKVRIVRMAASGAILEWKFDQQSDNDVFDGAVRALFNSYKSGLRTLPPPPPAVLEQINSRGMVVELGPKKG